jgi:hypothetical protein
MLNVERNPRSERSRRLAERGFVGACLAALSLAGCAPPTLSSADQAMDRTAAASAGQVHTVAGAQVAPARDETSFIVHFSDLHPLGRAQALEAEGRHAEAEQLARSTLREDRSLRDLCFDQFTLGGAEIVLGACTALAAAERPAFQDRWLKRFADMASVDYAEPNRLAEIENRARI